MYGKSHFTRGDHLNTTSHLLLQINSKPKDMIKSLISPGTCMIVQSNMLKKGNRVRQG